MLIPVQLLLNQFIQNGSSIELLKLNNLYAYTNIIKQDFEWNKIIFLLNSEQKIQQVNQCQITKNTLKIDKNLEKVIKTSQVILLKNRAYQLKFIEPYNGLKGKDFGIKLSSINSKKTSNQIRKSAFNRLRINIEIVNNLTAPITSTTLCVPANYKVTPL